MMNLELLLHVVVLKGQQELDIVQPSVHFDRQVSTGNLGQKDREGVRRARDRIRQRSMNVCKKS